MKMRPSNISEQEEARAAGTVHSKICVTKKVVAAGALRPHNVVRGRPRGQKRSRRRQDEYDAPAQPLTEPRTHQVVESARARCRPRRSRCRALTDGRPRQSRSMFCRRHMTAAAFFGHRLFMLPPRRARTVRNRNTVRPVPPCSDGTATRHCRQRPRTRNTAE
jgi:hypothetical protein